MPGLIPRSFIDSLIQRCDIVDVIENCVTLKKTGTNFSACCPFHQEKTPSFTVSPQKQFFHCFGCGANGNVIGFVMDFERVGFVEAIEILAQRLGLTVPQEGGESRKPTAAPTEDFFAVLAQVNYFYQQQLRQHASAQIAVDYLKQRGLSGAIAQQYQLGFAPAGWEHLASRFPHQDLLATGMLIQKETGRVYDRFRQRIMFPIHDHRGRIVGFGGRVIDDEQQPKYLNSPETALFHKSRTLYGLHQVLQTEHMPEKIVVVEGYMDVVALAQFGIPYAVATLGTATTADHIKMLSRYTQQIIFCFDGDDAGQAAAWKALQNSIAVLRDKLDLRFMFLPQGEDPDSFVRQRGAATFSTALTQAQGWVDFLLARLQQDANISTTAGKAHLLSAITPLLQQLHAPAYRELLLQRLSASVKMTAHEVEKFFAQPQMVRRAKPQTSLSLIRYAIALLLQQPTLAHAADVDIQRIQLLRQPGSDLLEKLLNTITQNPSLNTAQLVERWREHDYHSLLVTLAGWPIPISSEDSVAELAATLTKLCQQAQQHQINQLLHKAQTDGLAIEEKKQLQHLIAAQKQP